MTPSNYEHLNEMYKHLNKYTLTGCLISALVLIGCSSSQPQNLKIDTANGGTKPIIKPTTGNNPTQKGMSVYIDPQTGEFIPEPKQGQKALEITPEMQNATSTSSEGLVEEKSPVPGGGVMIDLKGRFQSPLIITQDPTGKPKTQHLNDLPKYSPKEPVNAEKQGAGHEQK